MEDTQAELETIKEVFPSFDKFGQEQDGDLKAIKDLEVQNLSHKGDLAPDEAFSNRQINKQRQTIIHGRQAKDRSLFPLIPDNVGKEEHVTAAMSLLHPAGLMPPIPLSLQKCLDDVICTPPLVWLEQIDRVLSSWEELAEVAATTRWCSKPVGAEGAAALCHVLPWQFIG